MQEESNKFDKQLNERLSELTGQLAKSEEVITKLRNDLSVANTSILEVKVIMHLMNNIFFKIDSYDKIPYFANWFIPSIFS